MKNSKYHLLLIIALLVAALAGCNTSSEDETPAVGNPPISAASNPTATEPSGSVLEATDEPSTEDEASEDQELVGNEGQLLDECLVGTWSLDMESMATYMIAILNEAEDAGNSTAEFTGSLSFTFDEQGSMSMTSVDFVRILDTGKEEANRFFDRPSQMQAAGNAQYSADGGILITWDQDYLGNNNLPGEGGEEVSLITNISPEMFLQGSSAGDNSTTYTCSGDTMELGVNEFGPVMFVRAD